MKKISQKQMCFYVLWRERKIDPERYIPGWEFLGEFLIPELNRWIFMSYKCPARLSDLHDENTFLERIEIEGKSGAKYFGYRIKADVTSSDIQDSKLLEFYRNLKSGEKALEVQKYNEKNSVSI